MEIAEHKIRNADRRPVLVQSDRRTAQVLLAGRLADADPVLPGESRCALRPFPGYSVLLP